MSDWTNEEPAPDVVIERAAALLNAFAGTVAHPFNRDLILRTEEQLLALKELVNS